jgi:hypothetical protein
LESKVLNWKAAAAVCAAVAALLGWRLVAELRRPPAPLPPAVRLGLLPPEGAVLGAADERLDAAVSPANDEVVFVATVDGVSQLWRRPLAGDRATPLAGTESASSPTWIIDQRAVSFFVGSSLKQTNLDTGTSRTQRARHGPRTAAFLSATSKDRSNGGEMDGRRLPRGSRLATQAIVFPWSSTNGRGCIWPNARTGGAWCGWSTPTGNET